MNFEQAQIMRRLKEGGDIHTFDLSGQDLDFVKSEVKKLKKHCPMPCLR
jgi:hypothetical protein